MSQLVRPTREEMDAKIERMVSPGLCCGPECDAQWLGIELADEVLALRQDLAEARAKAFERAADLISAHPDYSNDSLEMKVRELAKAAREAK